MDKLTQLDIKKRAMIEALEKSLGIVTTACKTVGISRQTHYDWYNNDELYKSEVDDIANIALDFAESQLHQQIKDKDTSATIFYLKCKGKRRGYIEKTEQAHTFPQGITINYNKQPGNDPLPDDNGNQH